MQRIEINKQKSEDIREVHSVFCETWLDTYPNEEYGITSEDVRQIMQKNMTDEAVSRAQDLLTTLPDNVVRLKAVLDGKIVGVCGGEEKDGINYLRSLYVLPNYQGLGIGMNLWKSFKEWTDPSKSIIVNVAVYNTKAITFYKKIGFVETGKKFTEDRLRFENGGNIPQMEMLLEV